ncbi:AraC family transcriptional regulator [Streptomyces sp. NPDC053048]|uniref:AraC family transcriptional regulator n=1 Tax=Streptomyces sp. NPDC053048 TaxID=3365694 RepID=UPI0037D124EF
MTGVDDTLSDLLMPLRLHSVFHSRWRARGPWAIQGEDESCAVIHYVLRNECCVSFAKDSSPITLREGDLAVFPHGTGHTIADRAIPHGTSLDAVLPDRRPGASGIVDIGTTGPATELLCGSLHYDAVSKPPVYQALPDVILLERGTLEKEPLLTRTLESITAETARDEPGTQLIVTRAFEMVFVLSLRVALENLAESSSELSALRHPGISRALLAIYREYAEPWTIDSLSRQAGMSRSAFTKAFRELVGEGPGQHLTKRRMQEAAMLLSETSVPQNTIPELVGYQSAVGFHLAFRKAFGLPPGEFRRQARESHASARPAAYSRRPRAGAGAGARS